jgi:hypothetical protein
MTVEYSLHNEYTLCESGKAPGGGTLTRYFNFAAATVTTVFREKAEKEAKLQKSGSYGDYVSNSVSVSVAAQMHVQNFSDFDSSREIVFLHKKLEELGGAPPSLEDVLQSADLSLGKEVKVSRPLQLKNG